jgi:vacuolar-type H+-ATPase subunit H
MSYDDFPYDGELDDEPLDDAPERRGRRPLRGRAQEVDAEELLRRVADIIAGARPMPLSASAMINKEEVLELLEEAIERLPDELREARWLRKEREEYLTKMRADGDEILDAARAHAERMVQRTEVVKSAEHRARRIVDGAEAEARRLRLECEDFCDQKLAGFEIVLERTLKLVGSGREKLQATNLSRAAPAELEASGPDQYLDQPDP